MDCDHVARNASNCKSQSFYLWGITSKAIFEVNICEVGFYVKIIQENNISHVYISVKDVKFKYLIYWWIDYKYKNLSVNIIF